MTLLLAGSNESSPRCLARTFKFSFFMKIIQFFKNHVNTVNLNKRKFID